MMSFEKQILTLCCLGLLWLGSPTYAESQQTALRERYFQEGEQALAEKRLADAAKAYEKLSQLDPKTAEVHAKLGLIYYQQGRFAEAVPAFRRALKLKPDLTNVDILLAMSHSELGHYTEALPGLEKGFRYPPDADVKRSIGLQLQRSYVGLQRHHQAAEVALELSRLYPEDPEVLYHTGRLYGDFAYLTMRKLSQVAPDSVWIHQAAGEAHESQGHYDLASGEYRKVLSIDPGRPGIHFRLGRVMLAHPQDARSQDEALKEFDQELRLDPTNAAAAYEAGEIHRKVGELDKAQNYFRIAVEHYPEFEEARIGLGRVLIALKEPKESLAHLEKAISLNPKNEVSHYQLSLAYKALGNAPGQQKELTEFQRLRTDKSKQQEATPFKPLEVTKQELDSEPAQ